MFQALDVTAFRWINSGLSNSVFDVLLPIFNGFRFFIPAVILLGAVLIWKGGHKAKAYFICLIIAICLTDGVVCRGLKKAIGRPRPFSTLENVNLLAGRGPSGSMPSAHAANSAAAMVVTALFYRRRWRLMVGLAATVGIARIYSGVHYPSDVLIGWGLGLLVGWGTVAGVQQIWRILINKLYPADDQDWPELLELPTSKHPLPKPRSEPNWFRLGLGLILILLLGRLIYLGSGIIELSEDEAYQWMWSKHPALSYFSKPPMIAYVQWAGRSLWGDREFAVRFFGPICAAGVSWLALLWLAREGKAKLGWIVLLVITATPIFAAGATLMTVDSISVLFWTAAMFLGYQAIRKQSLLWWVGTGIALFLSSLSKQTGLFQFVSFILVFSTWPEARRQLKSAGPWIALVIGLLGLVPVLVWNQQHGWITFEHLQTRAGLDARWEPTLKFFFRLTGEEFGLLNPIFFSGLILASIRFFRQFSKTTELERFLFWMGAPVFVGYFIYSLRALVQPNWIAPAVLPLLMWMVLVLTRQADWSRWLVWGKAGLALGFVAMFIIHDTRLITKTTGLALPTRSDPHTRVRGWKTLAGIVEKEVSALESEGHGVFVIADHYGLTSLLTFYMPEARVNVPEKRLVFYPWTAHAENQYYFWESYTDRVGQTAIYVQQVRKNKLPAPPPEHLARQFEKTEELGVRQVLFKDKVIREVQLFACRGLKPMSKW